MHVINSQIRSTSRRCATIVALGAFAWTSGCGSTREDNFDRSAEFTALTAQTDLTAPSDVSGLQGKATYNGVAEADFGGFKGTADAQLTADFDTQEIEGSMTSWKDLDPHNFELRGKVELSNGQISDDGSFTSQMAGNIERDVAGSNQAVTPDLWIFAGTANGQIYDSVDGASASHLTGSFTGVGSSGGVSGRFVASQ